MLGCFVCLKTEVKVVEREDKEGSCREWISFNFKSIML